MIALWMMYATIVAGLLGAGAALLEWTSAGSTRQRRWMWVAAIVGTVVVPTWSAVQSRIASTASTMSPAATVTSTVVSPALSARISALVEAVTEPSSLGGMSTPLLVGWAIMSGLALIVYGLANWALERRRRAWRVATVDGQPVLLSSTIGPAVVGALRPAIVVPEWSLDLPAEQRSLMLEHERQHVAARDPLVLHAAAVGVVLMPWNVALWWLNHRLRLAVELDCDARVLASSGRDARTYGTLLLNVCSRRMRTGAVLAPALLERTSSLAKRIIAMQPARGRFAGMRLTLGAAVACAALVAACEMPTPEMLAPDGKNHVSQVLYGETSQRFAATKDGSAAIVKQYFPDVARGDGGPALLFVVRSSTGEVVMAEKQSAVRARVPRSTSTVGIAPRQPNESDRPETSGLAFRARPRAPRPAETAAPREAFRVRTDAGGPTLPVQISTLDPNSIATVDVVKHAAGIAAPVPVSVVTIVLKPDATLPSLAKPGK